MPVYTPGGGGGPARPFDENDTDAVSKPYDVNWPINADALQQINEMFDVLFKSNVKRRDEIAVLEAAPTPEGSITVVSVTLTSAQVNTLLSVPVEIIPAGDASTIISPVGWSVEANQGATTYSGAKTVKLVYAGTTTAWTNNVTISNASSVYTYSLGSIDGATLANDVHSAGKAIHATSVNADTSFGSGSVKISVAYYTTTTVV